MQQLARRQEPRKEPGREPSEENEEAQAAQESAAPAEVTKESPIVEPITVVDSTPLIDEPTIDEPVTGTGNLSLQQPELPSGEQGDVE